MINNIDKVSSSSLQADKGWLRNLQIQQILAGHVNRLTNSISRLLKKDTFKKTQNPSVTWNSFHDYYGNLAEESDKHLLLFRTLVLYGY